MLVLNADLDLSQISEEYKKFEHKILQTAVEAVINSPIKFSPKRPSTSVQSPSKPMKVKMNL